MVKTRVAEKNPFLGDRFFQFVKAYYVKPGFFDRFFYVEPHTKKGPKKRKSCIFSRFSCFFRVLRSNKLILKKKPPKTAFLHIKIAKNAKIRVFLTDLGGPPIDRQHLGPFFRGVSTTLANQIDFLSFIFQQNHRLAASRLNFSLKTIQKFNETRVIANFRNYTHEHAKHEREPSWISHPILAQFSPPRERHPIFSPDPRPREKHSRFSRQILSRFSPTREKHANFSPDSRPNLTHARKKSPRIRHHQKV